MKGTEKTTKGTVWALGASSGLGWHTAEAFAKHGWKVIAGARSFGVEDENTSLEQPDEYAQSIVKLRLDVTEAESCEAFVKHALEISPKLDIVMYSAAVLVLGACENTGADELERVLKTNLVGAARMLKYALPLMRSGGGGRVILFSSINGLLGVPFQGAYTASKHALEGYAECLAMETKPYGIQVCLVEPGDHRGGSQRTRLHAAGENADSAYQTAYLSASAAIARDEAAGLLPERLGEKVVRNAERRHMRFRLLVAKPDQRLAVALHRLAPAKLNLSILSRYYLGGKANV